MESEKGFLKQGWQKVPPAAKLPSGQILHTRPVGGLGRRQREAIRRTTAHYALEARIERT
eukprot:1263706-Alexandrium_andersonii.AAC.1